MSNEAFDQFLNNFEINSNEILDNFWSLFIDYSTKIIRWEIFKRNEINFRVSLTRNLIIKKETLLFILNLPRLSSNEIFQCFQKRRKSADKHQ